MLLPTRMTMLKILILATTTTTAAATTTANKKEDDTDEDTENANTVTARMDDNEKCYKEVVSIKV